MRAGATNPSGCAPPGPFNYLFEHSQSLWVHNIVRFPLSIVVILVTVGLPSLAAEQPNVVIILADDLGYGDLACYNAESEIPTPSLDRFASQGIRFTDAHSPCTVCTLTRYSLMTGRMAFRSPRGGRYSREPADPH